MNAMILRVIALIAVGIGISLPLTALLIRWGHRAGTLDSVGSAGHDKTLRTVPNIGGVAIAAALVVPLAAALVLVPLLGEALLDALPGSEAYGRALLDRFARTAPTAAALVVSIVILHVMGLVDDRRGVGPGVKLLVQVALAAALAIWFEVRLLTLLGPAPSIVVTVLWIVAITNAINFMDNMDGLAAGVSAIAAAFLLAACAVNNQWYIAAVLALLIGGLVGFLVFNFPPAKIFMGDGGSLVVGFVLAVMTARTTFVDQNLGEGWYAVFMPVVILAIPLYDLAVVTVLRLRQGRSPFVGDQQHFSHRLVQRGLSTRGAVVVIWAATAVTGIGGISLGQLEGWQAILVGVQTLLVLLVIGLLEHASRGRAADDEATP